MSYDSLNKHAKTRLLRVELDQGIFFSNVHKIGPFQDWGRLSNEECLKLQLKLISKPAIKMFSDCIDIYKRRAFNHPMLNNHTIQVYDQLFMCLLQCHARELLALIYWCGLHTPVTGS